MPAKKMSDEQYAYAVQGGMSDLMEKKRKRNPQLYTKEFKAKVVAILDENNKRMPLPKKILTEKTVKSGSSKE